MWPYSRTNDFALTNFQSPKNANPEKHSYSGYGIGFDVRLSFSLSYGCGIGKSFIVFGVDNSSSARVNNSIKNILIHGKGPTQGLDDTKLIAEVEHS